MNQPVRQTHLITIAFETEEAYSQFLDYVFDQFEGEGIHPTNTAVKYSLRVESWLLDSCADQFSPRILTKDDQSRARQELIGSGYKPYAIENLDDFHIPGLPRPTRPRSN